MKPEKIDIMPFGTSISFSSGYNNSLKKDTLVALAGPITSFVLTVLCSKIELKYISEQEAIYSNILILLFNLIPIYPLDGGRIIKNLLNMKLGISKGNNVMNHISYIVLIIFTIISSISIYYYKNLAIFLICIFLWIITIKEKNGKSIDILEGK